MGTAITCTRRLTFCAGHRVMRHEGKCINPHGHNYVVEITAQAAGDKPLDELDRVIDFSVLKERIGTWLDTHWDHGFIANDEDRALLDFLRDSGAKLYRFPGNPTAEALALYLLYRVAPACLKDTGVVVTAVVVHETENCKAEATLA